MVNAMRVTLLAGTSLDAAIQHLLGLVANFDRAAEAPWGAIMLRAEPGDDARVVFDRFLASAKAERQRREAERMQTRAPVRA